MNPKSWRFADVKTNGNVSSGAAHPSTMRELVSPSQPATTAPITAAPASHAVRGCSIDHSPPVGRARSQPRIIAYDAAPAHARRTSRYRRGDGSRSAGIPVSKIRAEDHERTARDHQPAYRRADNERGGEAQRDR